MAAGAYGSTGATPAWEANSSDEDDSTDEEETLSTEKRTDGSDDPQAIHARRTSTASAARMRALLRVPTSYSLVPPPSIRMADRGSHPDGGASPDASSPPPPSKWRPWWTRIRYYVPVLGWLPNYSPRNLVPDIVAGVTVGCLLIPQSLSFSSLTNLDPVYGLYTSFFPLIIYFIFGTSRHLSVGAEAAMSLLSGAAVAQTTDPIERVGDMAALALMVGLISFLLGLFRLGHIDSLLSRATNRGFVTGLAVVVMVEQLPRALGLTSVWDPKSSAASKIGFVFSHLNEAMLLPCLFSAFSFAFLVAAAALQNRFASRSSLVALFPSIVVVVVVCELLTWGLKLYADGALPIVGDVAGGFVAPRVPPLTLDRFTHLLPEAAIICIVGYVESIIVAKEIAAKHEHAVSGNRELVAFGIANIFGSFFGSYPVFASVPRTSLANRVGARSLVYLATCALLILLTILFILPAFYYLPNATQAAIVFYAAYTLIEVHDVALLWRLRAFRDLCIVLVVFSLTIAVNLEAGIIVSLIVSFTIVMKETTRSSFVVLGQHRDTGALQDLARPGSEPIPGIMPLRMHESLYFANVEPLGNRVRRVELFGSLATHPGDEPQARPLKAIMFDMRRVESIDAAALQSLLEMAKMYDKRSIRLVFVRTRTAVRRRLELAGIDQVESVHFAHSMKEAMARLDAEP